MPSDILQAGGKLFELSRTVVNAVLDQGGDDEYLSELLRNEDLQRKVADLILRDRRTFKFRINYGGNLVPRSKGSDLTYVDRSVPADLKRICDTQTFVIEDSVYMEDRRNRVGWFEVTCRLANEWFYSNAPPPSAITSEMIHKMTWGTPYETATPFELVSFFLAFPQVLRYGEIGTVGEEPHRALTISCRQSPEKGKKKFVMRSSVSGDFSSLCRLVLVKVREDR